jgi:hypothetical protein
MPLASLLLFRMKRITAFAAICMTLMPVAASAETTISNPFIYQGQEHPWEIRTQQLKAHKRSKQYMPGRWEYYTSPWRSTTHALHPYHRNNYWRLDGFKSNSYTYGSRGMPYITPAAYTRMIRTGNLIRY